MVTILIVACLFLRQDTQEKVVRKLRSGVILEVPKSWKDVKPKNKMRAAQYALPDKQKEEDDAHLILYYFGKYGGGDPEATLDRWIGGFRHRSRKDAQIRKFKTSGALAATTVDLYGTYVAETYPGSGKHVNKPDTRMLAVILTTPAGRHFFKLVGPAGTVADWLKEFDVFVRSARYVPQK